MLLPTTVFEDYFSQLFACKKKYIYILPNLLARHYLSACWITFPAATCSPASEVQVVRFLWIYPENVSRDVLCSDAVCPAAARWPVHTCDIKGTDEDRSRCCLDLPLREKDTAARLRGKHVTNEDICLSREDRRHTRSCDTTTKRVSAAHLSVQRSASQH